MNFLVVGGSGFIGSAVAKYIESKGHSLSIWDLKSGRDIRDKTHLTEDIFNYDIVLIFAAITSQIEFRKYPEDSFVTNVNGLFNILEACRKTKRPKVLFASSSAIYGNSNKRMSEKDAYKPTNMYATSKVLGEYLMNAYTQKGYFEGLILRYFNTYGVGENSKGDYKSIISIFLESIQKDGEVVVYGDGEQRRDFINVKDVARITFELAMNHSGIFNVGTGRSISWNEILSHLESQSLRFKRKYIENPIRDYQLFTEANTRKLRSIGLECKVDIKDGIKELIDGKGLR